MSDRTAIIVAMIAALPPTIVALTGLVLVIRRIGALHALMNSRLDELVLRTGEAKRAEGVEAERARVK